MTGGKRIVEAREGFGAPSKRDRNLEITSACPNTFLKHL